MSCLSLLYSISGQNGSIPHIIPSIIYLIETTVLVTDVIRISVAIFAWKQQK